MLCVHGLQRSVDSFVGDAGVHALEEMFLLWKTGFFFTRSFSRLSPGPAAGPDFPDARFFFGDRQRMQEQETRATGSTKSHKGSDTWSDSASAFVLSLLTMCNSVVDLSAKVSVGFVGWWCDMTGVLSLM